MPIPEVKKIGFRAEQTEMPKVTKLVSSTIQM